MAEPQEKIISQWQLVWRAFRKHKLAMFGVVVLVIMYTIAIFAEFVAPYDPALRSSAHVNLAPQRVHVIGDRGLQRPFVYGLTRERDPVSFEMVTQVDPDVKIPIKFFVEGRRYKLLGLFETTTHLFGVPEGSDGSVFLFGTDQLGRDIFSRVVYGTRLSLSIGLIGVFLSLVLGVAIGGVSGYFGGMADNIIQRIIEFLMSIPTIPLWMGLAAALPANWSIIQTYLAITVILSVTGWTSMARVIRGRILSLREEDFISAAKAFGANDNLIIFRHLVPNCLSYILVHVTLAIPGMILGETALSFLGLGLRAPAISWGVLLQNSQNVRALASYPWYFIPVLFVVITVMAFNFVGDGLRDAADPYH